MAGRGRNGFKPRTLRAPSDPHAGVWAVQRIWESALHGNELLVAAILAMHGTPHGEHMRPSIATLSWWTSLSVATVKRILRAFRTRGVLRVTDLADPIEHRATEYAFDFSALPPKHDLHRYLADYRDLKAAEERRRRARRGGQVAPHAAPSSAAEVRGSTAQLVGVTAVIPEVKQEVGARRKPRARSARAQVRAPNLPPHTRIVPSMVRGAPLLTLYFETRDRQALAKWCAEPEHSQGLENAARAAGFAFDRIAVCEWGKGPIG